MRRIIAAIMVLVSILTLSGCKEVPGFMPSYWDGLTKRGAKEYIQNALQEKYGEEFVVRQISKRSGYSYTDLLADCSPVSDKGLVFQIEANHFSEKRKMSDTYIQSIVGRVMRNKAEEVLSKYLRNFAVEVYVYGLASSYDPKILSPDKATIENFANALPKDNLSVIWIAFDESDFGNDYDETKKYIEEIVENFGLLNCGINCYFVSSDIVQQCKKKVITNHVGYDYQIIADMEITLSSQRPIYRFLYTGSNHDLDLDIIS